MGAWTAETHTYPYISARRMADLNRLEFLRTELDEVRAIRLQELKRGADRDKQMMDALDKQAAELLEEIKSLQASHGVTQQVLIELGTLRQRVADVEVLSKLFSATFEYSEDNITAVSVPAFKAELIHDYSLERWSSRGRLIHCMLLGEYLPKTSVIASHIFKRAWTRLTFVLGISDMNDVRNGLLLFKPIEWAFDTSRVYFVREGDYYVFRLLDQSLHSRTLVDVWQKVEHQRGNQIDPEFIQEVQQTLGNWTFGQLEKHWVKSAGESEPNPFERALWFHANMATRKARENGWIHELPKIPDTASVGYDKEMVGRFFASMDVE